MLSGIQAILVSFDAHHHYPKLGLDLKRLAMPADTIPEDEPEICAEFQQIVEEAEEERKYLIIDTPTGFIPEHPLFELLP
jgi:hypothetical protein